MIKKVLILGSGALKIGQAGEFDYSGSQAIKALKEEGIQTVLVNPNIATVQTSRFLSDRVYFLPITPYFIEKIIAKENPDGILLSFGGQTGLNCGVDLHKSGVLKKYNIKILGSPIESIILTEDREEFANHLRNIGQSVPRSIAATNPDAAKKAAKEIGYPVMVRAAYALGGQSSGIVKNEKELKELVVEAFAHSPQVLVEQYLHHFKEIEYEVVRDGDNNCVTVCNMENFDPLGIHTGESIVVAPSQTLSNYEYHMLRRASIDIVRSLGIVGECNIQFAVNPSPRNRHPEERRDEACLRRQGSIQNHYIDSSSRLDGTQNDNRLEYYVIEVNARLSRSSALASKATGYPLAYVAAKLALGKRLWEVKNQVTKVTQSFFEPALDYIVVKIPRWDIEKFKGAHEKIGSSMKSVGEVMGIGRTFPEALQKAVRMLEIGVEGVSDLRILQNDDPELHLPHVVENHLKNATHKRLFAISYALLEGASIEKLHKWTGIDTWFLREIKTIIDGYRKLEKRGKNPLRTQDHGLIIELKQLGISDARIASFLGITEKALRSFRKKNGITPSVFQIDTLAAEFPAQTNYLYTTYHGSHHDVKPLQEKGVIVLGSGPYRIGSSVEFDWSSVSAARQLGKYHKKSIILNCNPETVSTDYDMSSRLYFEELSLERVLDIYDFENSYGVIVSVGGQTPNSLASDLDEYKVPLLGTTATNIDRAEDRNKFSDVLDKLDIPQPEWISAASIGEAKKFAKRVGYPVLIRPSYVLSGASMSVCATELELSSLLQKATRVNAKYPVTISKFWEGAKEIELDAVAQNGEIVLRAMSEHVEFAGVHSGDATIVFPAQRVYIASYFKIQKAARKLAREFNITGPFNIQFLAKEDTVSVIEMNLRASRTFPLISKGTGINFAATIVDVFFRKVEPIKYLYPWFSVVKAAQFSFSRLSGADPILNVEMASTGEAACFGDDVKGAFLKAMLSVGYTYPKKAIFLSVGDAYKEEFLTRIQKLHSMGYTLYTTEGTTTFIKNRLGIDTIFTPKGFERGKCTALDLIKNHKVDFIIIIRDKKKLVNGESLYLKDITDGFRIRRAAADHNIPLITDIQLAKLFVSSIAFQEMDKLSIEPWDHYVPKAET